VLTRSASRFRANAPVITAAARTIMLKAVKAAGAEQPASPVPVRSVRAAAAPVAAAVTSPAAAADSSAPGPVPARAPVPPAPAAPAAAPERSPPGSAAAAAAAATAPHGEEGTGAAGVGEATGPGSGAAITRFDANKTSVTFWLRFRVYYGQSIRVIGGNKALGKDPLRAVPACKCMPACSPSGYPRPAHPCCMAPHGAAVFLHSCLRLCPRRNGGAWGAAPSSGLKAPTQQQAEACI
jgi:hypothetical protein